MRKALCVGINYYKYASSLEGCVNDAANVSDMLWRHEDLTSNFKTTLMCATNEEHPITRPALRDALEELFDGEPEVALFYYSGHGAADYLGGYLCTSEIRRIDDGLPLDTLLGIVTHSKAKHKVIILDCCHSGFAGITTLMHNCATLPAGTTILSACGNEETALEIGGHGVFTSLLLDALSGGAMNLLGEVSPGAIYSYIDSSLGEWYQHPEFKSNVNSFISIRKNSPPIELSKLKKLGDYFFTATHEYHLDPTYEEDKNYTDNKEVNKEHEAIFADLREFFKLNLVVPVGEEYMYWAAVNSKACKLTALGQYYWKLIRNGKI